MGGKKKKKSDGNSSMGILMMPSPKQQIHYAAEHVARTAVENHPKLKKMRDEITRSVEQAVGKHLGTGKAKKQDLG